MSIGLNANNDGTGSVQIGGSDAIQLSTGLAATFVNNVSVTGNTTITGNLTLTGNPSGIVKAGTAVASTSGTSIDFTGIPSTVKRITVMFTGVSTSGTSAMIVQLGTGSTTYTTSGYTGQANAIAAVTTAMTSGFIASNNMVAANTQHGLVTICNVSGNVWAESGNVACQNNTNFLVVSGGSVSLAAVLTAIRITTAGGTDTFDAGTINILYE
jgi:hypothetical protein